jgi:hypothetical protein
VAERPSPTWKVEAFDSFRLLQLAPIRASARPSEPYKSPLAPSTISIQLSMYPPSLSIRDPPICDGWPGTGFNSIPGAKSPHERQRNWLSGDG